MTNGLTIFAGPSYFATCKKTGKLIPIFNIFSESEISLHFFMVVFDKARKYFHYDSFFPHYTMLEERREEITNAGAIEVNKVGEEECVHNWHIKRLEDRFTPDES